MVRHRLTADWTYDVGPGLRGSVVRGHLRFVGRGRTVRLSAFERDGDDPGTELARLLAEGGPIPDERIDETGGHGEARHAHWLREDNDGRPRWVLHGYTVTATGMVRSTVTFDDGDDLAWAVDAWRSIEPRG
jgi:hypothetical protein